MTMMKIAVGVEDDRYAKRLSAYFAGKLMNECSLYCFHSPKELRNSEEIMEFQILLAEENFLRDLKETKEIPLKILFHEGSAPEELKGLPAIGKYESAELILKQVYALMGETGPGDRLYLGSKQMIAVYSPACMEERELFSYVLARELARKREVLWICFSDFPAMAEILEPEGKRGMSELLYYSRKGETHFMNCLRSVAERTEGMDYVPFAENPENLHELNEKEYEDFFRKLREKTDYGTIVVDFAFLTPGFLKLLGLFDVLYVPMTENVSEYKKKAFTEYMKKGESEIAKTVTLAKGPLHETLSQVKERIMECAEIREILGEEEESHERGAASENL